MKCKCGCGKKIIKKYSWYTPQYILGHNVKGKIRTEAHRKNFSLSRKGHIVTEETRKKIRRALKGRKYIMSEMQKRAISETKKGKKFSEEHKKKLSKNHCSKKENYINPNYIDGRSKTVSPGRYGDDWFKIRLLIYKRDNWTCQECRLTMTEAKIPFHVHHIIPFLISFDNSLSNLITLCPSCHRIAEAPLIQQQKVGGVIHEIRL